MTLLFLFHCCVYTAENHFRNVMSLLCLQFESCNFFVFCRLGDTGLFLLVFIRSSRESHFVHSHVRAEFCELHVLLDFEPLEKRVRYMGAVLWKESSW